MSLTDKESYDLVKTVSEIGVREGRLAALREVREMVMREPVTRERHTKKGVKIRIAGSGEAIHDIWQKIDAMIAKEEGRG